MKIITISREFGSGGRELGKRLADLTGFDYYDKEIVSAIAQNSSMDPAYVENTLNNHGWKNFSISYCRTLDASISMQSGKVHLLLEQKRIIEQIAAAGKDCIIIGRNADVILQQYAPFRLFVCAEETAKLRRCMERAPEEESFSEKELLRKMKQIDKNRTQTRDILTDSSWGRRDSYHLTVNTTGWDIKDLAPAVANFADCWFGRKK